MNMMLIGAICALAGVVLMIMGTMWGLALLLVGACLVIAHWARLFKGAGYQADAAPYNGLNGQGRQQSEATKDPSIPQSYEE